MCILCVIQKWSRRIATMLPWLVIPLIGLWAFSQLLPPAFRFEITSPRLACVFVLLVTLFWYEILMPRLSAWRARRNARLRERKRVEAIELQKLRKTATKRCRNCLTPYKDQNPGGGRFMCSYCGHISKRPVLDMPVPPGFSNSGIIKDLVGKSGKIMNGKVWSDNGWIYGQDWLESGNCDSGPVSIAGKSAYWRKNGSNLFGADDNCLAEKSYSCVVIFACKLLASSFSSIRWLWRKAFGAGSTGEDFSSDADGHGTLAKNGENGGNFQESRGEKARRKAEEKRQARLERELLEEEERKQREEVARLVEERRKLRDEKMEAEKDCGKTSFPAREKDSKKEGEKRRHERRKEKDKGSSKSNSDVEEMEKRTGKESEKKCDFDKKNEADRQEVQKSLVESGKGQGMDAGHGKSIAASSISRGNAGNRYLDRMRGTIWSSSKAFSGSSLFGKSSGNVANVTKENKSSSSIDHAHTASYRRDPCPPERVAVKHSITGDDRNISSVLPNQQPLHKKSWQQLFTRSPSIPLSTNVNVTSKPPPKSQPDFNSPKLPGQSSSILSFDNTATFGLPPPFSVPAYPSGSPSSSLGFSPLVEPMFSRVSEMPHEFMPEEPELFEDPCYIPDPVSLLGPVSESLENFQLDQGTLFGSDFGLERPCTLKYSSASPEVVKPSPIESPLSRERHNSSNRLPSFSKAQDVQTLPVDGGHINEKGTWQMWNSSPLGQDGLGLIGGTASWLLPPDCNRSTKDDFVQQKTMASLFSNEDQFPSETHTHQNVLISNVHGNGHGAGTFRSITGPVDHGPWLQKTSYPPFSGSERPFAFKSQDEMTQYEMIYGSPRSVGSNHPFEPSQANCWPKKELAAHSVGEGAGRSTVVKPSVGGLFPNPDVQSLWSFD